MIDNSTLVTATDMRRAAAMLCHYQSGDQAGLLAIMTEAHNADESPDLAGAVVALFFELSPEVRTEEGSDALRELARAWAAAEAADLAAQDGHG
jgi:hypothetical protein